MRTLILSFLLMLATGFGYAQKNLREGIVITLAGDTLHGDIDYRTDAINAKQCVFIADGAKEAKTYLPGEIAAYRFLDNGRYYVSRTIPSEDKLFEQTLFLEYLVRGQMSVYYLPVINGGLFYFENEEGKLAVSRSTPRNATKEERRNALNEAFAILNGSTKAREMLWEKGLSPQNAAQLTAAYNNEVCPDGQCEIFKYRAKKRPQADRTICWVLKAGYIHYIDCLSSEIPVRMKDYRPVYIDMQPSFSVSAGMDYYLPRLCKGLLMQAYLDYAHSTGDVKKYYSSSYYYEREHATFHADEFTLKVGPAYQLPIWKVQPRISMGVSATMEKNTIPYDNDAPKGNVNFGDYIGLGAYIPLSKGAILVDVEYATYATWQYGYNNLWNADLNKLSFSVGYQF